MKSQWHLSHIQGYLGLGLVAEAAAEFARLSPTERDTTPALALRVTILQEQEDWPAVIEASIDLVNRVPEEASGWITWAYAARRAESVLAAEAVLHIAEKKHPADPTIQFNLACYACQLGDHAEARRRIDRAIVLDKKYREIAETDPDLAPLRNADWP